MLIKVKKKKCLCILLTRAWYMVTPHTLSHHAGSGFTERIETVESVQHHACHCCKMKHFWMSWLKHALLSVGTSIIDSTIGSLIDLCLGEAQPLHFGAGWLPVTRWTQNIISYLKQETMLAALKKTSYKTWTFGQNTRNASYTDSWPFVFLLKRRRCLLKMTTRISASMSRMQKAAIRPFFQPASVTAE